MAKILVLHWTCVSYVMLVGIRALAPRWFGAPPAPPSRAYPQEIGGRYERLIRIETLAVESSQLLR